MAEIELWQKTLLEIEKKINPQHFKTWISPIICKKIEKEKIFLSVNNKFIKEWIIKNYIDILKIIIK